MEIDLEQFEDLERRENDKFQYSASSSSSGEVDSETEDQCLSHIYYSPLTLQQLASSNTVTHATPLQNKNEKKSQFPSDNSKVPDDKSPLPDFIGLHNEDDGALDVEESKYHIGRQRQNIVPILLEPSDTSLESDSEEETSGDSSQLSEVSSIRSTIDNSVLATPSQLQTHKIDLTTPFETPVTPADNPTLFNLNKTPLSGSRYFREGRKCFNCDEPGHLAKDCTNPRLEECANCGAKGHSSKQCDMDNLILCSICLEFGHAYNECREKNDARPSDFEYVWKHYKHLESRYPKKFNCIPYCYQCGSKGHFGEECNYWKKNHMTNHIYFERLTSESEREEVKTERRYDRKERRELKKHRRKERKIEGKERMDNKESSQSKMSDRKKEESSQGKVDKRSKDESKKSKFRNGESERSTSETSSKKAKKSSSKKTDDFPKANSSNNPPDPPMPKNNSSKVPCEKGLHPFPRNTQKYHGDYNKKS